MNIPLFNKKSGVCIALFLSLFLISTAPARADTMTDWFTNVLEAYEQQGAESLAGSSTEALSQTAVPPSTLSGEQPINAYVQNRVVAIGPVQNSDGYEFIVSSAEGFAVIIKYTGAAAELTVPSILGGFAVEYIGDNAFAYCYGLTKVALPIRMMGMGNNVFFACMNLVDATLPSSITDIGNGMFLNCQVLKNVSLPANLKTIKFGMFEQCRSLEAVIIPNQAASIEGLAFFGCLSLKEVTVPPSVLSIADDAFYNNPLLSFRVNAQTYAYQYALSKGIPFIIMD